jgi:hypothetical protein
MVFLNRRWEYTGSVGRAENPFNSFNELHHLRAEHLALIHGNFVAPEQRMECRRQRCSALP